MRRNQGLLTAALGIFCSSIPRTHMHMPQAMPPPGTELPQIPFKNCNKTLFVRVTTVVEIRRSKTATGVRDI
jgi:hypothetical protein